MNEKFPYEDELLQMKAGEEEVLFLKGRAFLVSPATDEDIERIGKGYYCID